MPTDFPNVGLALLLPAIRLFFLSFGKNVRPMLLLDNVLVIMLKNVRKHSKYVRNNNFGGTYMLKKLYKSANSINPRLPT